MYNTPDWQRVRAQAQGTVLYFRGTPAQLRQMMASLLWMYPRDYPVMGMRGINFRDGQWAYTARAGN